MQVVPGELTLITGVPNSGKSEWIDALLCNINESRGWKFVLCSMENKAGSLQSDNFYFFYKIFIQMIEFIGIR